MERAALPTALRDPCCARPSPGRVRVPVPRQGQVQQRCVLYAYTCALAQPRPPSLSRVTAHRQCGSCVATQVGKHVFSKWEESTPKWVSLVSNPTSNSLSNGECATAVLRSQVRSGTLSLSLCCEQASTPARCWCVWASFRRQRYRCPRKSYVLPRRRGDKSHSPTTLPSGHPLAGSARPTMLSALGIGRSFEFTCTAYVRASNARIYRGRCKA